MFKKVAEIFEVLNSFVLHGDSLIYALKNGTISKYNLKQRQVNWVSDDKEDQPTIGIFGGNVFCNAGFDSRIIDVSTGQTISRHSFKIVLPLSSGEGLLCVVREVGKRKLVLADKRFSFLWEKEGKIGALMAHHEDCFFNTKYLDDQILFGYDLQSSAELWSFSVAAFPPFQTAAQELQDCRISDILGVYKDVLWLSITSGELIGLNYKTGEVLHQIGFEGGDFSAAPFPVEKGDRLPHGGMVQLDVDRGKLIGLRDRFFFNVNLRSPELPQKYIDVSVSMDIHNIHSLYGNGSFPIDDQFIYFCDDREAKIGVFDRQKLAVVWSSTLGIAQEGISQIFSMAYANGYWGVLDRHGVTHIFERV